MKAAIGTLIATVVLALVPVPRITVQNPKLLYAAAMYKTAVGDTDAALRLFQQAEQAQSCSAPQTNAVQTASGPYFTSAAL